MDEITIYERARVCRTELLELLENVIAVQFEAEVENMGFR